MLFDGKKNHCSPSPNLPRPRPHIYHITTHLHYHQVNMWWSGWCCATCSHLIVFILIWIFRCNSVRFVFVYIHFGPVCVSLSCNILLLLLWFLLIFVCVYIYKCKSKKKSPVAYEIFFEFILFAFILVSTNTIKKTTTTTNWQHQWPQQLLTPIEEIVCVMHIWNCYDRHGIFGMFFSLYSHFGWFNFFSNIFTVRFLG